MTEPPHTPARTVPGLTARPELRDYGSSGLQRSDSGSSRTQPLLPMQQPGQQQHTSNPYSIEAQAQLTLRMCELLGFKRVLVLSHADGCIAAVHAAAAALQGTGRQGSGVSPAGSVQQLTGCSPGSSSCGFEGQCSGAGPAASFWCPQPELAAQRSHSHRSLTHSPPDSTDGAAITAEDSARHEQQVAAVSASSSGGGPSADRVPATSDAGRLYPGRSAVSSTSSVRVLALCLLHPSLSGHQVPAYTRLLSASILGRSMLKTLLRSEVGHQLGSNASLTAPAAGPGVTPDCQHPVCSLQHQADLVHLRCVHQGSRCMQVAPRVGAQAAACDRCISITPCTSCHTPARAGWHGDQSACMGAPGAADS
jgi:hypothetical protein